MFVSGQKNIFLDIEFFDVSSEIEKIPKFLSLEKSGVKKTFLHRGQKNIFLNIDFFDFSSEIGNLRKFLIPLKSDQ